ncbi:hypothetical protein LX64_00682 [Chitinophaga skermanii]|uniref:Uncharacterized protein n=2 Tax=Chitinophaga skermanii TaxID=331697 RepID=A0A327R5V6_9BACT|nr:hypothetical protein LX64_00682 [Chitinophaga skermanii]
MFGPNQDIAAQTGNPHFGKQGYCKKTIPMSHLTSPANTDKLQVILNPQKLPLTPDKLRELSGLQMTDEKADEIIHSIRLFCRVLYQLSHQID